MKEFSMFHEIALGILKTVKDYELETYGDLHSALFSTVEKFHHFTNKVEADIALANFDLERALSVIKEYDRINKKETDLSDSIEVANKLLYIVGNVVVGDFLEWSEVVCGYEDNAKVEDKEMLYVAICEYVADMLDYPEGWARDINQQLV